jgi:oligosaccharyltransferase complex subunit beta
MHMHTYTCTHMHTQVSVRPFRHDEYERFIFAATPYYVGVGSVIAAFFAFSALFLFSY